MKTSESFDAQQQNRALGAIGVAFVALIWLGMVLGVSFLATTSKFMAPTLSLPTALDVGRYTFQTFASVELVLYFAMCGLVLCFVRARLIWVMAVMLGCIVLSETVWLIPTLDSRVSIILAGGTPEPSDLHQVYIALESIKAALLLLHGVWGLLSVSAGSVEDVHHRPDMNGRAVKSGD